MGVEKQVQNLGYAGGGLRREGRYRHVHGQLAQALAHVERHRVEHGAHACPAGGRAGHGEVAALAVPQRAAARAFAAVAHIAQGAGAGQHQGQVAVAQRRRGHAGGHGLHGGQRGLGLQKHALHAQGRIPRGTHRVRDVQAQAAVQRPAVGIAQLRGVVDHRPGKARVLQGVQPRGGLLLKPAEHDPRQLQQRFSAPCRGDALGLGDREDQVLQLLRRIRLALGRIGKAGGQRGQLTHGMGGIGRHFKRLYSVGRGLAALFQQLVQRLAAQLVPGGAGQEAEAPLPRLGGEAVHDKRRAAGLAEGALNAGQRVLLGGLRLVGAVDADPVAVVVAGGQLDAAVLHAAAQFIVHGHALQLAAEQLAGLGRGGAGRRGVGLGAHAEHFAVVAVRQVAVGEARAREDVPHELFVVGLARADCAAGRDDCRRVLGRAQAALDFHAGDTRVHQLPQMRDVVHVLQAQMAGFARLAGL